MLMSAAGIAGVLVIALINLLDQRVSTGVWGALAGSIAIVLVILLWRWAGDRSTKGARSAGVNVERRDPETVSAEPIPRWAQMLIATVTPLTIAPLAGLALDALWIGLMVAAMCTVSAGVMFAIVVIRDYRRNGNVDARRW
jgi:hypothetical protein